MRNQESTIFQENLKIINEFLTSIIKHIKHDQKQGKCWEWAINKWLRWIAMERINEIKITI